MSIKILKEMALTQFTNPNTEKQIKDITKVAFERIFENLPMNISGNNVSVKPFETHTEKVMTEKLNKDLDQHLPQEFKPSADKGKQR